MRKYALLFCLFTVLSLSSQELSIALQPEFFTFGHRLTRTPGGSWIVGGETGIFPGYPMCGPYVALVSSQGEVQWQHKLLDVPGTERGRVREMGLSPVDGHLYAAMEVDGCDYGLPGGLYKLDTLGNVIWHQELTSSFYLDFFTTGNILTADRYDGKLYSLTPQGGLAWEVSISPGSFPPIDGLAVDDQDRIFVFSDEELYLFNAAGELQSSSAAAPVSSAAHWPDHGILGLGETHLSLFSASGPPEITVDLSLHGYFERLRTRGNQIYLLGRNDDQIPILLTLDENLSPVATTIFPDTYLVPRDFYVTEERIILTGHETPDPFESEVSPYYYEDPFVHRGSQLFLQSFNLNGSTNATADVAVTEVFAGDDPALQVIGDFCYPSPAPAISFQLDKLKITVTNQGQEPLQRLNLNARFQPCWFICNRAETEQRTYQNLNLLPGESRDLLMEDILVSPLPQENTLEFCVWASLPNDQVDKDHSDNMSCETFVLTSTREPQTEALDLYPNPAGEVLHLRLPPEVSPGTLEIVSITGRTVSTPAFQADGQTLTIDVSGLAGGIYLLRLSDGKREWWGRVVMW